MSCICAEYIWIDGFNKLRSKTKVCWDGIISDWNYDGSSTGQATGDKSEVILKPCALFCDPFRGGSNKLVLCSTYDTEGNALLTNHRHSAAEIFEKYSSDKPWFGLEQEYFIWDKENDCPYGYKPDIEQGRFYCSVGSNNAFKRDIVEEHLMRCIQAGIKIGGINAEVAPGQWEFQIGICEGIEAADHLWVARYILERISETHGVSINYHPKPIMDGEFNGSGCHINCSTEKMRVRGGLTDIYLAINKLFDKHDEHMKIYGSHNDLRMTGKHETASYDTFTYGIADRTASIRVGNETVANECGYFEDRRPGSNIDPYKATSKLIDTIHT